VDILWNNLIGAAQLHKFDMLGSPWPDPLPLQLRDLVTLPYQTCADADIAMCSTNYIAQHLGVDLASPDY